MAKPYGRDNYMGEFANDAAALTAIQSRKWDSTNDGLETPQNGMVYYNTTSHETITYIDGMWEAGATVGDMEAADTIVNCTNDASVVAQYDVVYLVGDGKVADAAASLRERAFGLVLEVIDTTNCRVQTHGLIEGVGALGAANTKYYLGEAGALTTTEPVAGTAQCVGFAWDDASDDFFIDIQPPRERWEYPSIISPTGTDADIITCYHFSDDGNKLLDRTANTHDLTLAAGSAYHAKQDGIVGVNFDKLTYFTAASAADEDGANQFFGIMAGVRISDVAFSAAEILDGYNQMRGQ